MDEIDVFGKGAAKDLEKHVAARSLCCISVFVECMLVGGGGKSDFLD